MVGELVSLEGRVEIERGGERQTATLRDPLCQGDTIEVGRHGRAAVALVNDAVLRLDQNSTLRLINIRPEPEETSVFGFIKGMFASFSRQPRTLTAETPYLNATIEGTEFAVRVEVDRAVVTVFEGQVAASNDFGRLSLAAGESAEAAAGQGPEPRVVVRPRDAVQWALHYPPVLAALGGQATRVPSDAPPTLREAIRLSGEGKLPGAFARLEEVAANDRGPTFHIYRAGLLLNVGRVAEARADIDRALTMDPDAGIALALRAVIHVVQNRKDAALVDAQRAVELSPGAAAPKIALSFAQQAHFRLEAARETVRRAVTENPDDALARARLAELWLATGYRRRAREAAEKAVELAPDVARTQVVLGFAALARIDTETAMKAFARAIDLRSSDPLPWLGQGLAKIREGDLEGGRADIEVAVGLDSSNALLRAYLGKAYFEEKRSPLDAQQFELAKDLDPLDPTAYLYDAIRKQTENDPGGALDDIQASIARNDNRAVYRSRLQLDADRAARGSSLSRIYDDLGFHELAVGESSRSLALDPGNDGAHRFLSDTYRGTRRREIARVSELLQAQLLQDININPVQPSISETNLNIVTRGGPGDAGFNEFTPLFESNDLRFNFAGQAGNQDTLGGEGVVSAIHDWLSLSGGVFHYETDGFRQNHDINHDIQNIFAQAAITPELNIQGEFRHRDTRSGDLKLNFDPDSFNPELERNLDQDIYRLGARYSPLPTTDILLSYIHSERDERNSEGTNLDFGVFAIDAETDDDIHDDGDQVEGQVQHRWDWLNLIAGLAYSEVDRKRDFSLVVDDAFPGFFPFVPPLPQGFVLGTTPVEESITHRRGYAYFNVNLPDSVTWTLGASYDDLNRLGANVDEFNPKLGVRWDITDNVSLRGAAFQVVKPIIVANRTIEPTQVAGFNQLFDDTNGTVSRTYGIGADWQPMDNLFVGAEATWRDYEEVVEDITVGAGAGFTISDPLDRDENIYRAYVYHNPIPEVSLTAELVRDRYTSEEGLGSDFFPKEVKTWSVPLGARYFDDSGIFGSLGVTFVDQKVRRFDASPLPEGSDTFATVDAGVGYRLPKRLGILSFQVANLLDEDFKYQDDNFREFRDEPSSGPYIPDRTFLFRGSLNF